MAMKGFDPQFKDLTDYIIKITAEIWEGRAVGAIDKYYDKKAVRHTPYGDQVGVATIIEDTLRLLDEFPDRQLLPQDVIGDQKANDYHSSHRIIAVMHNRGEGFYGLPSGELIQTYAIADCAVRANQIYEEWELHDSKGLVLQMGYEPIEFVRTKLLPKHIKSPAASKPIKTRRGIGHQNKPDSDAAENYVRLLRAIWEEANLAIIGDYYHPACTLFLPGNLVSYGCDAADAFFMSYLAAFSKIRLSVAKVTTNQEKGMPLRVAVRWNIKAKHTGSGRFGEPSSAPVEFMAISHLHFYRGKILAEWLLIDELAILLQIELAKHKLEDE